MDENQQPQTDGDASVTPSQEPDKYAKYDFYDGASEEVPSNDIQNNLGENETSSGEQSESEIENGSDTEGSKEEMDEFFHPDDPLGVTKRIGKLTARNYEKEKERALAEQKASLLAEQNELLLKKLEGLSSPAGENKEDEPKYLAYYEEPQPENFEDWKEYIRIHNLWKKDTAEKDAVNNKLYEDHEAKQKRAQEASQKALVQKQAEEKVTQSYINSCSKAAQKYSDFEAVIHAVPEEIRHNTSAEIVEAIKTSDMAGEVLYYLARNLEEFKKISSLDSVQAGKAIGRIEAKIGFAPPKTKLNISPPAKHGSSGGGAAKPTRMEMEAALDRGDLVTYRQLRSKL